MKCEKCGIDILEGTLCNNCKNANAVLVDANVNQVPVQYDPVKDLMDETEKVNQVVIQDKDEIESTIPIGDNNEIPSVPVVESANSVGTEQVPSTVVTSESNVVPVQEVVVPQEQATSQQENVPVQENTQAMQNIKKNNMVTFIVVGVALLLVIVIIMFVFPLLSATKQVTDAFDTAKINTFVTEVQQHMDVGRTSFVTVALKKPASSVYFSNIGAPDSEVFSDDLEDAKNYYIYFDRNGSFQKIIIYDETFCYESPALSPGEAFDKSNVKSTDVHVHDKGDSYKGCLGKLISN